MAVDDAAAATETATAIMGQFNEDELRMMNHYKILQVPVGSSFRTIQQAFYKQARLHHPDKKKLKATSRVENDSINDSSNSNSNNQNEDYYYHKVQEAWECLRDPTLKQEYDTQLHLKSKRIQRMKQNSIPIHPNDCRYDEHDRDDHDDDDNKIVIEINNIWYKCRCGYEINASDNANEYDLLECPGCSLVYDASALFDNNDNDEDEDDL